MSNQASDAGFFEHTLALLAVAGPDGYFVRLNPAWEAVLGWSIAELCARPFVEFIHPDDREGTLSEIQSLASAGTGVLSFENRYRCKDGSYRHLRWSSGPPDELGRLHAVAQDITEERIAEQRARVFEDVILGSSTGLFVLALEQPGDPLSLRIVMANDAASKAIGIDLKPEIGRRVIDVFPNVARVALYASIAENGGTQDFGEMEYGDERVGKKTFAIKAYALPNLRVCMSFENVTERKRAEEALRQSIRQEEIIRAQRNALVELSTPLIPISDGVVIMPLIGLVDSTRAQQVVETLLSGIASQAAKVAILDVTGVAVVDTQVADALVRAAYSARMLGAEVMLTGIRPEVAQTMVNLDVDLRGIVIHGSLQAGVAAALARRRA